MTIDDVLKRVEQELKEFDDSEEAHNQDKETESSE